MDVIAERTYQVTGLSELTLRIGRPEREGASDNHFCAYEILGPLTRRTMRFGGVDPIQALLHAIFAASLDLELSEEFVRNLLSLHGQPGYLGLPAPEATPRPPGLSESSDRVSR